MKADKIEALLVALGTKKASVRNGWIEAKCPYGPWKHERGKDNTPSFAIHAEVTKKSLYKCFSCGMGGDLMSLHLDLSMLNRQSPNPKMNLGLALSLVADEFDGIEFNPDVHDYEEHDKEEVAIFPESWLDTFQAAYKFPEARNYLLSRRIDRSTADLLDLKYDPIQKRVCFPYRDPRGRLVGLQGRLIAPYDKEPDALRYYFYAYKKKRNMQYWLGEDTIDLDKPLVLVEGPFDYAMVWRAYTNVIASFSAGISRDKLQRIGDAAELVTFYDKGKGGDQARERVTSTFRSIPVTHVYPTNDGGDPGSMTLGEIRLHLDPHVKLSHANI